MSQVLISSSQSTEVWNVCSLLGNGASSTVLLVQNKQTQKVAAAKVFTVDTEDSVSKIQQEVAIHKDLKHPNILEFIDLQESLALMDGEGEVTEATALLLEYAPRGDVFDLLSAFNQMPLFLARAYSKQMVEAVSYLHENQIAHRDIKPENFLLSSEFRIKLADFGFACKTNVSDRLTQPCGTEIYFAPEQNKNEPYSGFEVDVFSLGIIIFILVAGKRPFTSATESDELYKQLVLKENDKFWNLHEELVDCPSNNAFFKRDFRDLIDGMLCYDPSKRMTITEVKNHGWLNGLSVTEEKASQMLKEMYKKKGDPQTTSRN